MGRPLGVISPGCRCCHYCGLFIGQGSDSVHAECRDAVLYARALSRARAMPKLPPGTGRKRARGPHWLRAIRRVGLERYLEVITGLART